MTKSIIITSLISFLAINAFATDIKEGLPLKYNHEISFLLGDSENGFEQGLDRSLAFDLQYMYKGFDYPVKPEVAIIYSGNIPTYFSQERFQYSALQLNGVYEIKYIDLLTPYVKAGLGYQYFSETNPYAKSQGFLNAGAGLKMHLSPRWALRAEVDYNLGLEQNNLLALVGASYAFGERAPVVVEKEPVQEVPVVQEVVPVVEPEIVKPTPTKAILIAPIPVIVAIDDLDIEFKFDSAELTNASKASLKNYAEKVKSDDKTTIHIVGNTDNIGDPRYNLKLSKQRAEAVKHELVINGIPADLITTEGVGEANPITDNKTKSGRKKNRRATITISEGQ